MRLSAPTMVVWLVSTLLFIAAVAVKYAGVSIPALTGEMANLVLLLAYALLWLGTIVRGM